MIDDGAVKALNSGASLLPSGVKKISGKFTRGDIIGIIDSKGKIFKQWNKVKVSGHVKEVLEAAKSCP